MALTPKVKMLLQPEDLTAMLDLPEGVEVLSMFVTNDPLSVTVILSSDDAFQEVYLPFGGFNPSIGYRTIDRNFFNQED